MTPPDTEASPHAASPRFWFPALESGTDTAQPPISMVLSLIAKATHGKEALVTYDAPSQAKPEVRIFIASSEALPALSALPNESWMDVRCRPFTIELSTEIPGTHHWLHYGRHDGVEANSVPGLDDLLNKLLGLREEKSS